MDAVAGARGNGSLPDNVPTKHGAAQLMVEYPHLATYSLLQQLAAKFPASAPMLSDGMLFTGPPPQPSKEPIHVVQQFDDDPDAALTERYRGAEVNAFSANVLTLKKEQESGVAESSATNGLCTARTATLIRQQLPKRSAWIVGVQEARTKQGCKASEAFVQLASGSHKDKLGVELRVSTTVPYAKDSREGRDLRIKREHVVVIEAQPRILAARIRAPLLSLQVLVTHAPTKSANDDVREEHWQQVRRTIAMIRGGSTCGLRMRTPCLEASTPQR